MEPQKVKVGETLTITTEIKDKNSIDKVTAIMPHNKGADEIQLFLISGNNKNGKYQGQWKVYDTHNKEYITKIIAVNVLGETTIQEISWWDDVETTWHDQNWSKRKKITIDGSKVTSETAIPLMLNINLPGVKAAGTDVRVTKLDGTTQIAREIECINAPNTDDVTLYFPFDTVAGIDSQFYVYWAPGSGMTEPAANSTYGSEAVWDANVVYNYHMAQYGTVIDSTSNDYDATTTGMGSEDLVDADYGKALDFDTTDDVMSKTGMTDYTPDRQVLRFYNYADITSSSTGSGFYLRNNANDYYFIFFGGCTGLLTNEVITIGKRIPGYTDYRTGVIGITISAGWHTLEVVWNSGAGRYDIVLDNVVQTVTAGGTHVSRITNAILYQNTVFGQTLKISNIHVESSVRNSDYRTTQYKNLNNPTATGTAPFYLEFGTEEKRPHAPGTSPSGGGVMMF